MKDKTHLQTFNIIGIGGVKYLHETEKNFDYLSDVSNNEVKIHLKFTKDEEKRKASKKALETFFAELL